jgi:hypothetical protein
MLGIKRIQYVVTSNPAGIQQAFGVTVFLSHAFSFVQTALIHSVFHLRFHLAHPKEPAKIHHHPNQHLLSFSFAVSMDYAALDPDQEVHLPLHIRNDEHDQTHLP